ncbi:polysaccharide deacetylase family protein [Natrinema longum]|uniref:Polysaccharide deacetylase family protein n=1 Tax=Natrinema longum TaxID=370324 RepID=A0A8A2UHF6_9EURY|nr:polysaccharide deacetylase family protein [Natrinema longum]MBZ6495359.1 polysaccharide deacetylase family protein [Natrinema longum]QSW86668.1 polysaccharide deacetylase family protein [Natrinema longum]
MKRRAYLVTAAAATLGGCSALSGSDTSDDPNETDGNESDDSDTIDEEPGSFDQFDDLSMWEVMDGSLELDEDRTYVGEQSGRMEAGMREDRVMIKRRFDSVRDLSDEFPAVAFMTEDDVDPVVQLTDTDGNRLLLQSTTVPGLPFAHHDFSVIDTDGDPDLSAIEHVKISAWAGEGRSVTVWVDDLHFVSRPETGKVLLQFDGGAESVYTRARSTLSEHDLPATVFVPTDYVGGSGYLSRSQLETLQGDGWTIGSQGMSASDLAGESESSQRDQIQGAIEWLEDNGFEDGANYFAYPLNRYDGTTMAAVEEHHDIGFVGGYAGHGNLSNPALAPRAVSPSADEATQLLDRTARFRTITTLTYGDLTGESRSAFEETVAALADRESAGDLEVVTPDDIASNHIHEE